MEKAIYVGTTQDALPGRGRVYYGEEACERLLPEPKEAARRVREFGERGLAVTLVFPPVSDDGLARAEKILAAVREAPGLECAANDYGLLSAARKQAPRARIVVGRVLSRVLARNIRDMSDYSRGEHRRFIADLRALGVARFDFDLFTLERASPDTLGFPMSIITPYALISFTRRCAVARCGSPDPRPFGPCSRQCRDMAFTMKNTALHGEFQLLGNKILKRMDAPSSYPAQVDRLVEWDPIAGLRGREGAKVRG